MRRTCDVCMEFRDLAVICGGNTYEGMGHACSRAQSLTTVHNVLKTCRCTHERARVVSRHSYKWKSRTGDMSLMDSVILFLLSTPGKMLRIVVGLVVIGVGILIIQGTAGFVVAVIGLIPIFAAPAGICLIAPLFGYTFEGLKRE